MTVSADSLGCVKGPTHALISTTAALGVCTAAGLAPDTTLLIAGGAAVLSKAPDQAELGGLIRHRGPTHHYGVVIALAALAAYCVQTWPLWGLLAVGGAAGYGLHIAADACTLDGVPGEPFKKDLHLLPSGMRFRTGNTPEKVLATVVALVFVGLVYTQAGKYVDTYGGNHEHRAGTHSSTSAATRVQSRHLGGGRHVHRP